MAKKKSRLPKSFTTVTPFSKTLAMLLFIILPFVGFYLGIQYQKKLSSVIPLQSNTNPISTNTAIPDKGTYTDKIYKFTMTVPSQWMIVPADRIGGLTTLTDDKGAKIEIGEIHYSEGTNPKSVFLANSAVTPTYVELTNSSREFRALITLNERSAHTDNQAIYSLTKTAHNYIFMELYPPIGQLNTYKDIFDQIYSTINFQ